MTGSAEEQAIKDRIADIVSKRFGGVYTSRAALLDVAEHILPLLAEAQRLAFQDFNKALREWAEHCKTRYVVDEPLSAKHDAQGWNRAMDYVIAHLASARAQASGGATEGA